MLDGETEAQRRRKSHSLLGVWDMGHNVIPFLCHMPEMVVSSASQSSPKGGGLCPPSLL